MRSRAARPGGGRGRRPLRRRLRRSPPAAEQADPSAAGRAGRLRAGAAASASSEKPSLVVLPFDNLSDDKEQGYLADGITEDLTTELARIPDLFVISRNAAFTYKGKAVQPAVIAKELGVRYLLEGSIRRVGDDIRINAQLIDGESSGHMWAERFDGAWSKVFELQDEMVGQIATALKLRLVESQRAAQIAGGTSNPAAYDAWLRGLELENRGTPEDIAKAADVLPAGGRARPRLRARLGLARLAAIGTSHGPEQEKALGLTWPEIERQNWTRPCGRPKSVPLRPIIRYWRSTSFGSRGRTRRSRRWRRPSRSIRATPGTTR